MLLVCLVLTGTLPSFLRYLCVLNTSHSVMCSCMHVPSTLGSALRVSVLFTGTSSRVLCVCLHFTRSLGTMLMLCVCLLVIGVASIALRVYLHSAGT